MTKHKSGLEIEIESGIPIPNGAGRPPTKYPLSEMKIGQSFVIEDGPTTRNSIYHAARHKKIKVTARKTADGMLRVWRVS